MIRNIFANLALLGLMTFGLNDTASAQYLSNPVHQPPSAGGSAGIERTYILNINGDSQANGTAEDASGSGFTNNGRIYIANASQVCVLANPGVSGFSGIHFGSAGTGIGPWKGFAIAWMAKYPTLNLCINSDAASGSFAGIGPSLGTANVTVTSPNTLTVNSGTVNSNEVITGTGLVDAATGKLLYSPFSGFVSGVGMAVNPTVTTVTNVTATRYNGTLSWSPTAGLAYTGNSGSNTSGARWRMLKVLSSVVGGQIVCDVTVLGDNDKSNSTYANVYQAGILAFVAQKRLDYPMAGVRTALVRVRNVGAAAGTIRTAVANIIAQDPLIKSIDMDAQAVNADALHYKQAGLDYMGAQAFTQCGL